MEDWEDGRTFTGSCQFAVDDLVRIVGRDRFGRVERVVRSGAGYRIVVVVDGVQEIVGEDSLQRIAGDPRDPKMWVSEAAASARDLALTLTWTKLRHPLSDVLYSFNSSKTLFRPYQFLPALKILDSPTGRLLIADEVGLGKTIEAGLVWTELEHRTPMRRTLVVTPSSLTLKWRMEMSRRFDRELEIIKPNRLAELADALVAGNDPELHGIVSLEGLRSATDPLEKLSRMAPRFDLVIVDEAHALRNLGTRSNLLGRLLSDWADHLLFLSATPINLGSQDLYNLLSLLDDGLFQDSEIFRLQLEPNRHLNAISRAVSRGDATGSALAHVDAIRKAPLGATVTARPSFRRLVELLRSETGLTAAERSEIKRLVNDLNTLSGVLCRTRKVDVPDAKAVREPHQIEVSWAAEEKDFYEGTYDYLMARARAQGVPPGFATQMPLRQLASCLPAMRARMIGGDVESFIAEIDDSDDDLSGADLDAQLLSGVPVAALSQGLDSKFDALQERLTSLKEQGVRQVMIFSTFRGTIAYLRARLADTFTVDVLHGGIPMQERQPVIDRFRDGAFEILIASEVASEGLDFEFCNVLVNYDLPWNPMRVEQRIGRLDRFGQKNEKILILNMHVPGTIESDILERLYERIGIFKDSIGDLEPILRDEFKDIAQQILDPNLNRVQRQRRADEIALAVEQRHADLKRLNESRGALSTIDQLSVEGLTDSGPADGRYVGAAEVRLVMEVLTQGTGASITPSSQEGIFELVGNAQLSDLVWHHHAKRRSRQSTVHLQADLRNGTPTRVTFDAAVASARDVELLSARHPLVEVAVGFLEADELRLRRYGLVEVSTLPPRSHYAVQVDLVDQRGIRPALELWATAVDVDSGQPVEGVGEALLTQLASGDLRDTTWASVRGIEDLLSSLEDAAWARRGLEEPSRRAENEALALSRIDARRASLNLKLRKAGETLDLVRREGRDQRVIRMHEGRIRNLSADLDKLDLELEEAMAFSLVMRTVALLEVVGPAT
ncbi:hypothetical protein ASE25_04465 [Terrabacter sp. Root85]|uniref:helicase-related protein n=1 Tax=Terrabacter sp. Root85 TaxID=1736603 RepID=UPI0006FC827C|nr:helicase-related protein [Terrabacter sp. Root85]KRC92585.1 hypothetical protein ASE25_04465 [Terrabacter sp. Root85]